MRLRGADAFFSGLSQGWWAGVCSWLIQGRTLWVWGWGSKPPEPLHPQSHKSPGKKLSSNPIYLSPII